VLAEKGENFPEFKSFTPITRQENTLTKKLSETLSPEELAKRKEYSHFFRTMGTFFRFMIEYTNLSVTGPFDFHFLDGIYILLHNRVIKEYAYPEDRLDHPITPTPIPEDILTRLFAFLEDCAISKAAFYRRDWLGFVWEIVDENAYAQCCQRHGFSETDYQVVWLKEVYGESGERIKKDN